jgi:hypothetical protein
VRKVEIAHGECRELESMVKEMAAKTNQRCFGLQHFVAGFAANEFRHWYIAMPSVDAPRAPLVWIPLFILRSSFQTHADGGARVQSSVTSPLHVDTVACRLLVDELLRAPEYRDFFQNLLRIGIRALRLDCGYNSATRKAFLSEFACSPDASSWTAVHSQDLPWRVGQQLGAQLASLLSAPGHARTQTLRAPSARTVGVL